MSRAVHDVLVVGGGPAGLSVAYDLVRAGRTPLVLERTSAVGDVWRHHYDGLRLNTGRVLSRLAGESIPRRAGGWPSREDFVRYLEGFPGRGRFEVITAVDVGRIARSEAGGLWEVHAAHGEVFRSGRVVVATGGSRVPVIPAWSGRESFRGRFLHASQFRNAADYRGLRVLVVGSGNSAAEIASRLTEHAAEVICAVRTAPHLLPRGFLGIPMAGWGLVLQHLPPGCADRLMLLLQRATFGDLAYRGLPLPKTRLSEKFRETNVVPTLYAGFARDVRAGRIRIVGEVRRFDLDEVEVNDSVEKGDAPSSAIRLKPDVVVAGTGYRSGLHELIDVPGLIDEHDRPRVTGAAQWPGAPGLFFIGQSNPLTGQLREIRREAHAIARTLAGRTAPVAAPSVGDATAGA